MDNGKQLGNLTHSDSTKEAMPFQPDILLPNPEVRQPLVSILEAALAAVDPYQAVQAVLQRGFLF